MNLLSNTVEDWVHDLCERWHIPGLSVSVVNCALSGDKRRDPDTQFLFHGIRDALGQPYQNNSLFCIASCSKIFTSYALGILIHDGVTLSDGSKLDWDTKVAKVLPDWKLQDEFATKDVNLIDLLSFRTGLPGHDRFMADMNLSEQIAALKDLPLSASIREVRQYSNLSSNIGAHIVSELSGMPFAEFMSKRVFVPLGMNSTTYHTKGVIQCRDAVGSFMQDIDLRAAKRALWRNRSQNESQSSIRVPPEAAQKAQAYDWVRDPLIMSYNEGCGGVWSTSEDMTKWMREIISPTLLPVDSSARQVIFQPHAIPYLSAVLPETGFYTYGLGTYVLSWRGRPAYFHAGMVPGQYTAQYTLPDAGVGVCVHSNDDTWSPYINQVVARTILDTLLAEKSDGPDWEMRMMNLGAPSNDEENDNEHDASKINTSGQIEEGTSIEIEGLYEHAAYPPFDVRRLDQGDVINNYLSAIQRRSMEELGLQASTAKLYIARIPLLYVHEVLFVYQHGNVYKWIAVKLYPKLGEDGKRDENLCMPFIDSVGTCTFRPDGLAMGGDWWLSGGKRRKDITEASGKHDCEVWYAKAAAQEK